MALHQSIEGVLLKIFNHLKQRNLKDFRACFEYLKVMKQWQLIC